MNRDRINYLLEQYEGHTASEEEVNELFTIIRESEEDDFIKGWLTETLETIEPARIYDQQKWEPVLQHVFGKKTERPEDSREALVVSMKPRIQTWKRIAIAASIVGVLLVAGYWFVSRESRDVSGDPSTALRTNDVKAPDKNRASIKLADGRIVYLDSAGNGELVDVNGVKVVKTADGKIVYQTIDNGQQTTVQYNTLFNPRGSIVMDMTLADGSRVWLNAGSSITYPVAFIGNERKVSIDGEAYFEVAHNPAKPFIVNKGEMNVTVLGTHFNVNAYDDESEIRVTLLEGSVNVSRQSSVVRLKPGEQAKVVSSETSVVRDVDLRKVMAWKNGKFEFGDAANVEEIMRQVARWYDVEIVYERKVTGQIGGSISRTVNVSQVLKMLALTGEVDFEIKGKQIIVR